MKLLYLKESGLFFILLFQEFGELLAGEECVGGKCFVWEIFIENVCGYCNHD